MIVLSSSRPTIPCPHGGDGVGVDADYAGEAVMAAATSGSPKFFLGTDSAPHAKHAKVRSGGIQS